VEKMQVTIIAGNVGKDAVLRRTGNGDAVLGFSVAVDNGKDKDGNKRDSTWFNCSVWGKRASSLEEYIKKGTKLTLSGRVDVNVYEGKGSLNLSVNELTFMGNGSQDREPAKYAEHDEPARDELNDDIDIPF
jgi:single-strand DNA-binding protein